MKESQGGNRDSLGTKDNLFTKNVMCLVRVEKGVPGDKVEALFKKDVKVAGYGVREKK